MLVAALASAIVGVPAAYGVFDAIELRALDRLFAIRGATSPRVPVTIVEIDDATLKALGAWPLPRAMHGQVLERLSAAGAAAIGVDLVFSTPSAHGPADDAAFEASMRRTRGLVLGGAITYVSEGWYQKTDVNLPLPALRRAARAIGHLNHSIDADGVVRRATFDRTVGDIQLRALAIELQKVAAESGVVRVHLPQQAEARINFAGPPGTFPRVSYHRVLREELAPDAMRGRIAIIGTTAPALRDVVSTPFALHGEMPGVELHANVLRTILLNRPIREMTKPLYVVLAAVWAAGAVLLTSVGGVRGLAFALVALVAIPVVAAMAFASLDLWIPVVASGAAIFLGAIASVSLRR
jgi:CHASE2 domain-containing sensor protein